MAENWNIVEKEGLPEVLEAVKEKPEIIQFLNWQLLTDDVMLAALEKQLPIIESARAKERKGEKLSNQEEKDVDRALLVSEFIWGKCMKYQKDSEEFCRLIVKIIPWMIGEVEFCDEGMRLDAVRVNPWVIQSISGEYQTEDICRAVVEAEPATIRYVVHENLTDLHDKIVRHDPFLVQFLACKYCSLDTYRLALSLDVWTYSVFPIPTQTELAPEVAKSLDMDFSWTNLIDPDE